MRRREFIALLGAATAWPLLAHGQNTPAAVIGFVHSGSPEPAADAVAAFRGGLAALGYIEGLNLAIEYRWAHDDYDRLPALLADVANRPVALIAAAGGPVTALAAKSVTTTLPILFSGVTDPVGSGLVASLNHPGGNITGTAGLTTELDPKRLEFLRELVPNVSRIGALINPNRPDVNVQLKGLMAAAHGLGMEPVVLRAGNKRELEDLPQVLREHQLQAVLVTADPFFVNQRKLLVSLMAQSSMPAMYQWRELVLDGGLISYGASRSQAYYEAGVYAGRILKGEKPAALPVLQPTKFELTINLKTARTLGLDVPSSLLARADEVIE
ncbi:ABC transporter substrate-binding protein [Microvirga sp. M2]|uniref:ABC transporter substrate-binding protein n=1 Tax=Microvirga sp. M2 TaxID=3073270 RepID=UPI0039C1D91F